MYTRLRSSAPTPSAHLNRLSQRNWRVGHIAVCLLGLTLGVFAVAACASISSGVGEGTPRPTSSSSGALGTQIADARATPQENATVTVQATSGSLAQVTTAPTAIAQATAAPTSPPAPTRAPLATATPQATPTPAATATPQSTSTPLLEGVSTPVPASGNTITVTSSSVNGGVFFGLLLLCFVLIGVIIWLVARRYIPQGQAQTAQPAGGGATADMSATTPQPTEPPSASEMMQQPYTSEETSGTTFTDGTTPTDGTVAQEPPPDEPGPQPPP